MESGKWKIRFCYFLILALDVLMLATNIRINSLSFESNGKVVLQLSTVYFSYAN